MSSKFELTRSVVVITGGARGIGRATALALREAGAVVAIGDIDDIEAKRTGEQLGIFAGKLDVSDPESVEDFHTAVEDALGPVQVWINNAGIMPVGPMLAQDDATVNRIVSVNLLGVINGTRSAARRMRARGAGRIVNIASVAGRVPAPGLAVYNATKFGVVGFGEAVDAELEPHGVRVSTVFPTFTDTGLLSEVEAVGALAPMSPQDVADAVVKVIRTGQRQISLPSWSGLGTSLWLLIPRPVARFLRRRTGLDRVFLEPKAQ
ncbi:MULTISPECIES: SDR family NAD(P)-dependent oxidoreductase [unclassified Mycobacterium]|uniref:SDR family NAD(P)-dependent oxidoreductase n=1 Tax=unclassified Mycobacterium TaxID=2642494 RepID=UPI000569C519|nr:MULTISPECIES: SDR family NAD(P)-dependent oxidoreductase [unclassified Mycobacterium]SEA62070.1 Short-chain dehydrogenase [Mycobacterium sp. 283mftsu]